MAEADFELSLTETDQFRRLVKFLEEVRAYALESEDWALEEMVDECHCDLEAMYS